MSVEVYVERLVVEGFEGVDGRALERELGRSLGRELERRLGAGTLDRGHLARLEVAAPVRSIDLTLAADATAVGAAAARAVADLLAPPGGRSATAGRGARQEPAMSARTSSEKPLLQPEGVR